jgi:hypothetical protein
VAGVGSAYFLIDCHYLQNTNEKKYFDDLRIGIMAHLLAKLGKEALKPSKIGNVWHKPILSAKNVARLKKEVLQSGGYAL